MLEPSRTAPEPARTIAPLPGALPSDPPAAANVRKLGRVGWRMALTGFAVAVCGALFAVWVDARVETVLQSQLRAVLQLTRDTAAAGVLPLLETAAAAARAAASDPEVQGASSEAALASAVQRYLRQGRFSSFAWAEPLVDLPAPLARALAERGSRDLVVAAARPRPGAPPELFVLVPRGQGALVFGLSMSSWTKSLLAARPGTRGESYAFDRWGRMISESRYDTPFGTELATRAVRDAVSGKSAIELEPYRDARGVPVVGAYSFFPQFDLGVVSEIDEASAYETLSALQMALKCLVAAFALSALALLAAAAASDRLQRRAQTAELLVARFGQYRLVRKIGEGGMGAVYLASHEMLRRQAAIKLLRPDKASKEAIARFEREVRVTATLKHPNTVAVYDYGRTERGDLFYVMEYLEGFDLENLVRRFGPMPGARVLHYLRQLCGSLAEAHAAQLVHRDIKPANLLACRVGGVADVLKVVDFGVAKSLQGEALGLTVDRVLLGTPEYMAPELFESADRASAQSDLYSVGAVAYFLLTGHTVFEARSLTELSLAQLTRVPDPPSSRLAAPLDPALESAVMACLAKRREQRPASARSLLSLLERSPLAMKWTQADAEAWWQEHAGELEEVRISREPAEPSPEFTRIRPVVRA